MSLLIERKRLCIQKGKLGIAVIQFKIQFCRGITLGQNKIYVRFWSPDVLLDFLPTLSILFNFCYASTF